MQTSELWQQACEIYMGLSELDKKHALEKIQKLKQSTSEKTKIDVFKLVEQMFSNDELVTHLLAPESIFDSPFNDEINIPALRAGDILDQYTITEQIGKGGMSSVYLAERSDANEQKPVAVKVFDNIRASNKLINHFKAEQAILSKLNHPNIISMHYGSVDQNGLPFMVMDYVESASTIDQYVAANKLKTQAIVKLIQCVSEALAYAHGHLVVHRDIKPSNLLIDANGVLQVVDFGIAQSLDNKGTEQGTTTLIALTPGYAAPEQINNQSINVQSDVFSLGAVLLSLLAKQPPLPTDRMIKGCQTDDAYIGQLLKRLNLNSDLKNIINKALQNDPKRRYLTMQALVDDLSAWLDKKTVSATPDSLGYRLKKFSQRRPAVMASTLTLFISLFLALTAMMWQVQKTQKEAEKVNQVKNFMLNTFSVTDPDVKQGEEVTATELLNVALREIHPDTDDELKAELLQSIGTAYGNLGNYPKAVKVLSEANNIDSNDVNIQTALLKNLLAEQQLEKVASLTERIEKNDGLSPINKALLLQAKATLASSDKKFNDAEKLYLEAIKFWRKMDDIYGLAQARREYATVLDLHAKTPEALKEVNEILIEIEGIIPESHSVYLKTLYLKGFLLTALGQFELAQDIFIPLQQKTKKFLGEKHPLYTNILMNRINVNRGIGQIEEADALAVKAQTIITNLYDADHFNIGNLAQIRATLSMMRGDFAQAAMFLKEASRIYQINFGVENQSYLVAQTDLANMLNRLGNYQEAKKIIEAVYSTQLKLVGKSHRDTFAAESQLGLILSNLKQHDDAISVQLRSLESAREQLGESNPLFLSHLFGLGKTYQAANLHQQAVVIFQEIYDKELLNENDQRQVPFKKSFASSLSELNQHQQAITLSEEMVDQTKTIFGINSQQDFQNRIFLVEQLLKAKQKEKARGLWPEIKSYFTTNKNQEMSEVIVEIENKIND
ncbi:serine/threonine-protein kinase [Marinicella sp. S1101]|uniref:serine/threonine-protein kinase n=1 Tax=Marinicella marina TaxID=2996016 RepID=UPI0022608DC8|nr:serine/threonine-protein kinase [Marinicella marina]MCX7552254.1 serine/threonine-protein kinase [Marinicella marina]MDJ1139130.1 serine/threonine-protein kinase [Marinicella marina]